MFNTVFFSGTVSLRKQFAIKYLLFILLFVSLSSCEKSNPLRSDPVSNGPVANLFSLKPGNKWKYITYEYFFGKERILDTLTVEITKEVTYNFNEKTYTAAVKQNRLGQIAEDCKWLYSNGENGVYQCGGISSADTVFKRDLIYKNPVNKGESWPVPSLVYDPFNQKFFIEEILNYDCYSTNDTLETPAGTFACTVYHYKRHPDNDVLEYWEYFEYYAPNIGRVGIFISRADSQELLYKSIIISYDVK
ncbi:MAG: hypothetical protein HF300_13260 [Ignavibacteria bacterium]|jgi:hypothetical protein|nr:hypothetical protein [Ignavibacteria bacterium]MCU7513525.1 hypothetical protein [Ignavibacteria bacterium]MCU7520171.1 hypothetical protein [Ignavibacteria bacterium]MCU7526704.1 hypothetical protein [Ignavibacteria bacterium]